jgi:regulator of chromosome condensation
MAPRSTYYHLIALTLSPGAGTDAFPPRRAGASIASTASGTPRRSSRPSISVLPTPTPKKSAPASAAAKRSRETSVAGSIAEGEEGADSATPSKKRRVAALPVPKKRRAVVTGINAIPALFPVLPPFTFEPAPVLPSEKDKPRTAFVFGDGGFGQHGLGADDKVLCEIKRPRIHAWFEKSIEEAKAGEDKAWEGGIAQIECGGMHTLAVDGEGKVSRVGNWGMSTELICILQVWSWGFVLHLRDTNEGTDMVWL